MKYHKGRTYCITEFRRLNIDLDWSFCATMHVNRKHEWFKSQWSDWASREKERRVKEWHAQTQNNHKAELAELKEIVKT